MVVQSSLATASHDSKGCVCVCVCHVSAASFPISPLCEPLMTVSCKIRVHFSFFVHIFRPCFRSVMYSSQHSHVHTLTFTHSRSHTHVHTHIHTHVHHVKRPAHQKLKPFAHTDERRPDFGVSLSHQSAASVPLSQLICIVCVSLSVSLEAAALSLSVLLSYLTTRLESCSRGWPRFSRRSGCWRRR